MSDWTSCAALVVEDSTLQRAHLVHLLKISGFGTILEACNGSDALRVLDEYGAMPIPLVLTDLDMPEMDGFELIRHLSERQLTQNLVVTSARDPRLLEIVESMGSDDASLQLLGTLTKPVRLDDLSAMLEHIGKSRHTIVAGGLGEAPIHFSDIEHAVADKQFVPFFQPKVSMESGLIAGVEALARWRHPEKGMLAPIHFIPAIEGTPMMEVFTLSIVEQTLQNLSAWRLLGLTSLTASVNLSADNLANRVFTERLTALVAHYRIPPASLIWEVTETMLMNNVSESLANLARLGLKGFGLAMDDYGIGYSSIQQFSRCPFTELKIDRAFVNGAARRANRRVILESAIEMGHRLNVKTVAEGVENQEDWDLLHTLGCDLVQGYMIAEPMPAVDLPQWIKTNRQRLKALSAPAELCLKKNPPASCR